MGCPAPYRRRDEGNVDMRRAGLVAVLHPQTVQVFLVYHGRPVRVPFDFGPHDVGVVQHVHGVQLQPDDAAVLGCGSAILKMNLSV